MGSGRGKRTKETHRSQQYNVSKYLEVEEGCMSTYRLDFRQ